MEGLSKHAPGSIKELASLAYPLFLSLISSSLMVFCDRFFLSHYSLEAFKAVGIAGYLAFLFQVPIIRLTAMNQALIARSLGEGNLKKIGPYTWQTIWCSSLIALLFLPISYISGTLYFARSEVEPLCRDYYSIMLIVNCIFPFGLSLAAFQTGIGKTKTLALVTLISNLINVLLDYVLINGVSHLLPPLGIRGAALATLIAQGTYCGILFYLFVHCPEKDSYQTRRWKFKKDLFKESFKMGVPRAISSFVGFLLWILSIQIVSKQGGDYLILISFGATIWAVTSTINESIIRSLVTTFSYFLGKNDWSNVWKSLKSGIILFMILFAFFSIPFALFNQGLIHWLIGNNLTSSTLHTLSLACYWLWIYFLIEGITYSSIALLTALKESLYIFKLCMLANFVLLYLPFIVAFQFFNFQADKIWMITWLNSIGCFLLSALKIRSRYKNFPIASASKIEA